MAGHPSVKKRQKELQRKERQAEKLARRDERRTRPNAPAQDESLDLLALEGAAPGSADAAPVPPTETPAIAPSDEESRRT